MEKHRSRFVRPELDVTGDWLNWSFGCPYAEEDAGHWQALLFEAFGTNSVGTVQTFLQQLSAITGHGWDAAEDAWRPDIAQLNTVIGIIASTEPQNEAQAAMAAQMAALHMTAMGLAKRCANSGYPDERTAATLARVSKAYAGLARTMAQLQGKATRHEQHFHYHDERHVHVGGGSNSGGQAHACDIGGQHTHAADPVSTIAALPRPCPNNGHAMPSAGSEGQASLPDARWWQRLWSAVGRG
jgi:hypothetical protein